MSFTTWTPQAVASEAFAWSESAWRMVASQPVAATMKLVDTQEEQDLLESLLEESLPARPGGTVDLDDLLAAPFRSPPWRGGSRFRGARDPGVFYGAQSVRTAGAELGYWRWRFLRDAVDLERLEPVAQTAFRVDAATQMVDLRHAPFDRDASVWQDPTHYDSTQQFARVARQAQIGGIVYRSVRDPQPAWCLALLTPTGFAKRKPRAQRQTWYLTVSPHDVTLRCETEAMHFSTTGWQTE